MSRGQSDFDDALRDALAIRSAYYDLLDMIESWEHLRFVEANEYLLDAGRIVDEPALRRAIDSAVGACVSEYYSRLPNTDGAEAEALIAQATKCAAGECECVTDTTDAEWIGSVHVDYTSPEDRWIEQQEGE